MTFLLFFLLCFLQLQSLLLLGTYASSLDNFRSAINLTLAIPASIKPVFARHATPEASESASLESLTLRLQASESTSLSTIAAFLLGGLAAVSLLAIGRFVWNRYLKPRRLALEGHELLPVSLGLSHSTLEPSKSRRMKNVFRGKARRFLTRNIGKNSVLSAMSRGLKRKGRSVWWEQFLEREDGAALLQRHPVMQPTSPSLDEPAPSKASVEQSHGVNSNAGSCLLDSDEVTWDMSLVAMEGGTSPHTLLSPTSATGNQSAMPSPYWPSISSLSSSPSRAQLLALPSAVPSPISPLEFNHLQNTQVTMAFPDSALPPPYQKADMLRIESSPPSPVSLDGCGVPEAPRASPAEEVDVSSPDALELGSKQQEEIIPTQHPDLAKDDTVEHFNAPVLTSASPPPLFLSRIAPIEVFSVEIEQALSESIVPSKISVPALGSPPSVNVQGLLSPPPDKLAFIPSELILSPKDASLPLVELTTVEQSASPSLQNQPLPHSSDAEGASYEEPSDQPIDDDDAELELALDESSEKEGSGVSDSTSLPVDSASSVASYADAFAHDAFAVPANAPLLEDDQIEEEEAPEEDDDEYSDDDEEWEDAHLPPPEIEEEEESFENQVASVAAKFSFVDVPDPELAELPPLLAAFSTPRKDTLEEIEPSLIPLPETPIIIKLSEEAQSHDLTAQLLLSTALAAKEWGQTPTPPPSPPHLTSSLPPHLRISRATSASPMSTGSRDLPESRSMTPHLSVKPAWSLRASDAPALGLASSASKPEKLSFSASEPIIEPEEVERSQSLPGSFDFEAEDQSPHDVDTPPHRTSLSRSGTTTAMVAAAVASTLLGAPSSSASASGSSTSSSLAIRSDYPRRRNLRSPLDIALAMQLRPALGLGADPAWMVRFLMAIFGWLAVLVGEQQY